ncbi:MAG: ADP-glyceromanno-heptose 6-epimerase [Bdellovibrionales bacterium]
MWIITGATGFIGSALAWELNEHGWSDLILSDHVSPDQRPGVVRKRQYNEFIPANDLFAWWDSDPRSKTVRGVFHMGACSSTTETDESYLQRNNVEYSQKIWNLCARAGIPLVYASSAAVYGDGKQGFDDAGDPEGYTPLNLYGWSKLRFDIWAQKQSQTPSRWYGLRFFNVYGPNEYHKEGQSSVVYKAFHQIRDFGSLKLFRSAHPDYKDGEQLRDFVYVKDITRWMRDMMAKPAVASGIYNMGYGQARTWLDLARATFAAMETPVKIEWIDIPENIRQQYQYYTQARMERLLAESLSRPRWSLEEGITDYVRNHLLKKDPYL